MPEAEKEAQTFKQKLLFYTTAFFILLGTFSLFAFLFLVPFVIDPAFTTIFMQFDENPAICYTVSTIVLFGSKNCSWASCREGCTKDIYQCTQIRVNYKLNFQEFHNFMNRTVWMLPPEPTPPPKPRLRYERAIRDYSDYSDNIQQQQQQQQQQISQNNYKINSNSDRYNIKQEKIIFDDNDDDISDNPKRRIEDNMNNNYNPGSALASYNDYTDEQMNSDDMNPMVQVSSNDMSEFPQSGLMGNDSEWYFTYARLFPNVKGCGYPPMLNCSIWLKKFVKEGTNFSCYYSKVDPGIVISDLDYWQNTLNLVYSMAIPIPSFIISVIYLTFAYFKIYNEDEDKQPLDQNAEEICADGDEEDGDNVELNLNECDMSEEIDIIDVVIPNGAITGGPTTPNSTTAINVASFGQELKVKMADDMSRESLDGGIISNSASLQGNLSKTMTTSISTPPGPTAAV